MADASTHADHQYPDLDRLRRQIDDLDHALIALLEQRNAVVERVAAFKREHAVPIRDAGRERAIIADRRAHGHERALNPETIESIFRLMLWASRDRQAALNAELPADVEPRRVAVIGGLGQMGRCFATMFEGLGNEVLIADLNTPLSPAAAAAQGDVVLVCVPIDATRDVIEQIGPHVRGGALLADITSTKTAPVQAMLEHSSAEVLGMHPLFGPSVHSMQGQRIVLTPGRGEGGPAWMRAMLQARELLITETTPEQHDRAMAVVQVLTHFSTEVMGRALQQFGLPLAETLEFTSPVYTMELLMTARHFAQSPHLYAAIQMNNPMRREATDTFLAAAQEVAQIVASEDRDALAAMFDDVHRFFGDFSERALEQSSYLIDRLVERS